MNLRIPLLVVAALTVACRGPRAPAGSSDETPGLAKHHRTFVNGCEKKPMTTPEYCECAWGEFRGMFSEEEMGGSEVAPGKLQQFKSTVARACIDKLPEETVKANYDKGCVAGRPEYGGYCDCTWAELRGTFTPGELADEETIKSLRFEKAKRAAVKACATQIPESTVKKSFMGGCAKDPALNKFCSCAWVELRKYVSPVELETGDYDEKTVFPLVEHACGKHRPKGRTDESREQGPHRGGRPHRRPVVRA